MWICCLSRRDYILSLFLLWTAGLVGQNRFVGFEKNEGQFYNQDGRTLPELRYVKKSTKQSPLQLQLRNNGFSYELIREQWTGDRSITRVHRIDMGFVNGSTKIISESYAAGPVVNYYTRGKRIENIKNYSQVIYEEVWPNIDVVFRINPLNEEAKYEFRLKPGAKLSDIQFELMGSDDWSVENNDVSELVIETSLGKIRDRLPYAYALIEGQEKELSVQWKKLSNSTLGFSTSEEEELINHDWVIDPEPLLMWGTWYGGTNSTERSYDIVIDSNGNPFYTGITNSTGLATSGVYQTNYSASNDGYVMGVNRGGDSVIWMTYFGDTGIEVLTSITMDNQQNLYVCGESSSFKGLSYGDTTSDLRDSTVGGTDIIIAKFNPKGKILWSGYLGDSADDIANRIVYKNNNIYVVGGTNSYVSNTSNSYNFIHGSPSSKGAKTSHSGGKDAFYLRLDTSAKIVFGGLYGGDKDDEFTGIDVLENGRIAVLGCSKSDKLAVNFSSGHGSQLTSGTNSDAILGFLDKSNDLKLLRYYGGEGADESAEIRFNVFDSSVYICGTTLSQDSIHYAASVNKIDIEHQLSRDGKKSSTKKDAFIAKIKSDGSIKWSRFYGGTLDDFGYSVSVDSFGFVYLSGETGSKNFFEDKGQKSGKYIATDSAWQPNSGGGNDGFFVKFKDANGQRIWGSFVGGDAKDAIHAVETGLNGDVFISGYTQTGSNLMSQGLIKNSIQSYLNGSEDNFFARFNYCRPFDTVKFTPACKGDSLQLFVNFDSTQNRIPKASANYKVDWSFKFPKSFEVQWFGPNKWTSTEQNPKRKITIKDTGLYTVITTNEFGCIDTSEIRINQIYDLPSLSINSKSDFCKWDTIKLQASSSKTNPNKYNWTGPSNFTKIGEKVDRVFAINGETDGWYYVDVIDSNGCKSKDSILIKVGPDVKISANSPVCINGTVTLQATGNKLSSVYWSGPAGYADTGLVVSRNSISGSKTGIYTAIIKDRNNCLDTQSITVVNRSWDNLKLTFEEDICVGDELKIEARLLARGGHNGVNFLWTPVNSKRSRGSDSTFIISKANLLDSGVYKLSLTDSNGCKRDTQVNINVYPLPSISISVNDKDQCYNSNEFIFSSTKSNTASFQWYLNDGKTISSNTSPSKEIYSLGSHIVQLEATSSNGCKIRDSLLITVYPNPKAKFSISDDTQCVNNQNFVIVDNTNFKGGHSSYWELGDGNKRTTDSFSYSYSKSGIYEVMLITKTNEGCTDTIRKQLVVEDRPTSVPDLPVDSLCYGSGTNTFSFGSKSTSPSGKIINYFWTFESKSSPSTSSLKEPTVSFKSSGTKTNQLIVEDENGCFDTATIKAYVLVNPIAKISLVPSSSYSQCFRGNRFNFESSSTQVDSIVELTWSYGPTNDYKATSPNNKPLKDEKSQVIYKQVGVYSIKLIVRDTNGCIDSVTTAVTVKDHPKVLLTSDSSKSQCVNRNAFGFTGTASNSSVGKYKWFLGGGSASTVDTARVQKDVKFSSAGTKNIRVIYTDSNTNCSDTSLSQVIVGDKPIASFNIDSIDNCLKYNRFDFVNKSTTVSNKIGFAKVNWIFDSVSSVYGAQANISGSWGNITTSSADNLKIRYRFYGLKKVTLIVTDSNSCGDTAISYLNVLQMPTAKIGISPSNSGCISNNSFTFTDSINWSTGPATNGAYNWDFDFANSRKTTAKPPTANTSNPSSVSYDSIGKKSIRLVFLDANGCKDTSTTEVEIFKGPSADFTTTIDSQCLSSNSFVFKEASTSTYSLNSYVWDFGNDSTDYSVSNGSGNNKIVSFKSTGTKSITLTVSDINGCTSTKKLNVVLLDNPTADFTINSDVMCKDDQSFNFDTLGTSKSVNRFVWFLDFDNAPNDSITGSRVTNKKYNSVGPKRIRLKAIDNNGCYYIKDDTVNVLANPKVSLSNLTSNSQCQNNDSFSIKASPTWVSSKTGTINWVLGKGSTTGSTNGFNLNFLSFQDTGVHYIKVVVTDSNGCKGDASIAVRIKPVPISKFTIDSSLRCRVNNLFKVSSLSTNHLQSSAGLVYKWKLPSISNGTSPYTDSSESFSYSSVGVFNVGLTVKDNNTNCEDYSNLNIRVLASPKIDSLTTNDLAQCQDSNIFIFSPSITWASSKNSYNWTFDTSNVNSDTSDKRAPSYSYGSSGNKIVQLIVNDANGCNDTLISKVTVFEQPKAKITLTDTALCISNHLFEFDGSNSTSMTGTSISAYTWSFDSTVYLNPNSSNEKVKVKYYTGLGNSTQKYLAKLKIKDSNGCFHDTSIRVTIYSEPTSILNITAIDSCLNGNSFSLSSVNSIAVSQFKKYGYTWIIDSSNNQTYTGNGKNIGSNKIISYSSVGNKTVGLIVTDTNGCTDTSWETLRVYRHPKINFISNNRSGYCTNNNNNSFIPSVTWISNKSGSFSWAQNFNGYSSRVQNSTDSILQNISYSSSGDKTVNLIITDRNGCEDSLSYVIYIEPLPTAKVEIDTSDRCLNSHRITLKSKSISALGTTQKPTVTWYFNPTAGNNVSSSKADSIELTYSQIGYKSYDLIAIDSNGCSDTLNGGFNIIGNPLITLSSKNGLSECLRNNEFQLSAKLSWSSGNGSINWDFDQTNSGSNISSSTSISPDVRYNSVGDKKVTLYASDNNGCKDTSIVTLSVKPHPTAVFTITNDTQCLQGNEFSFSAANSAPKTGVNAINEYDWNFNGSKINNDVSRLLDTLINPDSVSYFSSGTKKIILVVSNNFGCKDTVDKDVKVNPKPLALWTLTLAKNCFRNHVFSFKDSVKAVAGSKISSYKWSFGSDATPSDTSGNGSNVPSIDSVYYSKIGRKSITLTVKDASGCIDTFTSHINVFGHPQASIEIDNRKQCLGSNQFEISGKNSYLSNGVKIKSYSWDLGNNVSGLRYRYFDSLTKLKFTKAGIDTIKLIVVDSNSCADTTYQTIEIKPNPVAQWILKSDSIQCLYGNSFDFDGTNSTPVSKSNIKSYSWDFGKNAKPQYVNVVKPVGIVFQSTGKHLVTLTVTDSNGCSNSLSKWIEIRENPEALITASPKSSCLKGNSFDFRSNSKSSNQAPIKSLLWTFYNNASVVSDTNNYVANLTYSDTGSKLVTLLVRDTFSCNDSVQIIVKVNGSPKAKFNITTKDTQCLQGNQFIFDASQSQAAQNSNIRSYTWNFGLNASKNNSTGVKPDTITYTTKGKRTVTLIVLDSNGCSDTVLQDLLVSPKPSAFWSVNTTEECYRNQYFNFSSRGSKGLSGTSINSDYSLKWDFGKNSNYGSISGDSISGVIFDTTGIFNVILYLTEKTSGCFDTFNARVKVLEHPSAQFYVSKDSLCLDDKFDFNASSSSAVLNSSITSYQWTFNSSSNKSSTNGRNITGVRYNSAGEKSNTLIVQDRNGCNDTITKNIWVKAKPYAYWTSNDFDQCLADNVFKLNAGSSQPVGKSKLDSLVWDFSSATGYSLDTTTLNQVVLRFNTAGEKRVVLTAYDSLGCKDTFTASLSVYSMPISKIEINDTAQCYKGQKLEFDGWKSTSTTGITDYKWLLGKNGNRSNDTGSTVKNILYDPGRDTVRLVVVDSNGCQDTSSKEFVIYSNPKIKYTVNDSIQCLSQNEFDFKYIGTYGSSSKIRSYKWTFSDTADIQYSAKSSPQGISFKDTGLYNAHLIVIDDYGCSDTLNRSLSVLGNPVAVLNYDSSWQCLKGNKFTFESSKSTGVGKNTITEYNWFFDSTASPKSAYGASNKSVTYTSTGSKNVRLVIVDLNGCSDTVLKSIEVRNHPLANINVDTSKACLRGNKFTFNAVGSSSANIKSALNKYEWNFDLTHNPVRGSPGDSVQTKPNNIDINYQYDGTYYIQLVLSDKNGCKDTALKQVTILPHPIAAFSVNNSTQCYSNSNFNFDASTSKSVASSTIKKYIWNLGTGASVSGTIKNDSNNINQISYSSIGTKSVSLIIQDSNSCYDTIVKDIIIHDNPKARLVIDDSIQCFNGHSFDLYASKSSAGTGQKISSYHWDFGTGANKSSSNNDTITGLTYRSAGHKRIRLIVSNSKSCDDTIYYDLYIRENPTAKITITQDTQCYNYHSFDFRSSNSTSTTKINKYNWDFGGARTNTQTTSSTPNKIQYSSAGKKVIKLIIEDINGCADSVSKSIWVLENPEAIITTSNLDSQCLNRNSWNFNSNNSKSNSGLGISSYLWTTQEPQNPTYSSSSVNGVKYKTSGLKKIVLAVKDANKCRDTTEKLIFINSKPIASISVTTTDSCFRGHSFQIDANSGSSSSTKITSYKWDLDSGSLTNATNSSTLKNIRYRSTGKRIIRLIVLDTNGCSDTSFKNLNVIEHPIAAAVVNDKRQCISGNSFEFKTTGTRAVTNSKISNYQWNFPSGSSKRVSSDTVVSNIVFSNSAKYTSSLIVKDQNGCSDTQYIDVWVNRLPVPVITIKDSIDCFQGNSFDFSAKASKSDSSTTITSYLWDFDVDKNGGKYHSKLPTGSKLSDMNVKGVSYDSAGIFNIKLVVKDGNGCIDSGYSKIQVLENPLAKWSVDNDDQCLNGNTFSFKSTNSLPANKSFLSNFAWQFGSNSNPSTSDSATVRQVVYSSSGRKTVVLTVTDSNGCKDTFNKTIYVRESPVARLAIDSSIRCDRGHSFYFDGSRSIHATGSALKEYRWSYGDSRIKTGHSVRNIANVQYGSINNFKVELTVIDSNGCKHKDVETVWVKDHPLAAFNVSDTSLCHRLNAFDFDGTISKGVTSGSVNSYNWEFDFNGTSSNPKKSFASKINSVKYSSVGKKVIRLIITDTNGCKDTVKRNIYVKDHPKAIIEKLSLDEQCLNGNIFNFNSTLSKSVLNSRVQKIYWTFGDSSIPSSSKNDTATNIVYTSYGAKLIRLIVTDSNGCSDTTSTSVDVIDNPEAALTASSDTFCYQTQKFVFDPSNSTGGYNQSLGRYTWKLSPDANPDTITRTSPNKVSVKFDSAGIKTVKLYVENRKGCKDTFTKNIVVLPNPYASWVSGSYVQCLKGNEFNFNSTNTQSTAGSSLIKYQWNFGTGAIPSTSTKTTPSAVSYSGEGKKVVVLTVTDANGCSDTFKHTVLVKPNPTARFIFGSNGNNQCFRGHIFDVDAQKAGSGQSSSPVGGSSITKYYWDFGSGSKNQIDSGSTVKNITYSGFGKRNIKLIIKDANGCDDTLSKEINVKNHPVAQFTINQASQCYRGNEFIFRNTGSSAVTNSSLTNYKWSFGNNSSPAASTSSTPAAVSYSAIRKSTVILEVTDKNGCTDTIEKEVEIKDHPKAGFSANENEQCFDTHKFEFSTTDKNFDYSQSVGGSYLKYFRWDYGSKASPSSSSGANDSVPKNITYGDTGLKLVKLIVTDSNGCEDTSTNLVRVKHHPKAMITVSNDTQCLLGNRFAYNALATKPANNSNIKKFTWSFDYGANKSSSNLARDTIVYNSYGSRSIYLLVEDVNGCFDSVRYPIRVHEMPEANWVSDKPDDCLKGSNFDFESNNTKKPSVAATGSSIQGVRWDFGSRAIPDTSRSVNVSNVTYATSGEKKVTLTVYDRNGCIDTFTSFVLVKKHPNAKWSVPSETMCFQTNAFKFTADSSTAVFGSTLTDYTWSFSAPTDSTANPSGSNKANPVNVTYSDTGYKRVSLIVKDKNNCPDTVVGYVHVLPNPEAKWIVNNDDQCYDLQKFNFESRSEPVHKSRLTAYKWDFGNFSVPGSSTLENPKGIEYTSSGFKRVVLTVTDSNRCVDTFGANIRVREKPLANWSVNTRSQCLNSHSFTFTSNGSRSVSQSRIVSYKWSFGLDASRSTDTAQFPSSVTYSSHGFKTVRLTVTDLNGCSDTFESMIEVQPRPIPDFIINSDSQCLAQNRFIFTNNTKLAFGSIKYTWDFGDGSKRVQAEDTNHRYSTEGSYRVKLIATTNLGCRDSIDSMIVVHPMPIPDFIVSSNCAQGNTVAFYNGSKISSGSITYDWDFGSGFSSSLKSPYFTYPGSGKYRVLLNVESNYGCKDSMIDTIQVFTGLKAHFKVKRQQCGITNRIPFTNTSYVPSGVRSRYYWDFGDGKTSSDTSPVHQYSSAGVYKVKLLISGNGGCKDSIFETVSVFEKPDAGFQANDTCTLNGLVSFINTSTVKKDSLKYKWNFDDGRSSNDASPKHSYSSYGTYNIKLVVTTNHGCIDSVIQRLEIFPKPFVTFKTNDQIQCGSGNFFKFYNNTKIDTGKIKYYWSFGDGNNSIDTNPTHVYTNYGRYKVTLRAASLYGCWDTISTMVNVVSKPTAGFTHTDECIGMPNILKNTTKDTLSTTKYNWLLGNGVSRNTRDVSYKFASAGLKNICLVADNGIGSCLDTLCQNVEVYPIPTPSFNASSYDQCGSSKPIVFTNTTTLSTGTFKSEWDFGDSLGSQLKSPSHKYGQPGTYLVKLKVISNMGCSDSIGSRATTIKISENPQVDFDVDDTCWGGKVKFVNTTFNDPNKWQRTYWNLGDGNVSFIDSHFNHKYNTDNKYRVSLVVTLKNNCTDSFVKNVTIHPVPKVKLISTDTSVSICQSTNLFIFKDSSTITGNSNLSSLWTVSDGDTSRYSIQNNFQKSFSQAGKFWIKLRSTSGLGCSAEDSTQVEIFPGPTADFQVNDSAQCLRGNNFEFRSNSYIPSGGGQLTYKWDFGDDSTATDSFVSKYYEKPGYYRVVLSVTSSFGCSATRVSHVRVYDMPEANFTVNNATQCLSSNKYDFINNSTSKTGNGTLRYIWEFSPTDTSHAFSPSRSYNASGRHLVNLTAISSFGCVDDSMSFVEVLPNPDTPFVSVVNAIPCHGQTGKLEISRILVGGGTPPYTYSWNGGNFTYSNVFDSAAAGSYNIIIRDSLGCESNGSYYFAEPEPLRVTLRKDSNASCYGKSDGGASVDTVFGGVTPYRFSWSNASQRRYGKTLSRVKSGLWSISVTDNNGCLSFDSIQIDEPYPISANVEILSPIVCYDSFGTALVSNVTGGTKKLTGTEYYYLWDGETQHTGPKRENLKAGSHNVQIIDANNCSKSLKFALSQPTPISFNIDSSVNIRCYDELNGRGYVSVSGGTPTYDRYTWFNEAGDSVGNNPYLLGVGSGKYTLAVIDHNGCPDTMDQELILNGPPPLSIFNLINQPVNCVNGSDGEITVAATGGNGGYEYKWELRPNPILDSTISGLKKGTYNLRVTDLKGCFIDTQIYIDERMINRIIVPSDSMNVCEFDSITLSASIKDPVSYKWVFEEDGTDFGWSDNSELFLDNIKRAQSGYYRITASDRFGCEDDTLVFLRVDTNPILSVSSNPKIACIGSPVDLSAKGANSYRWFRMRLNPTFGYDTVSRTNPYRIDTVKSTDTGIFYVMGTSKLGCSAVSQYRLKVGLDSIIISDDVDICEGGLVQLRARGGVEYQWESPTGKIVAQPSFLINPVDESDEGLYKVIVTDKWDCVGSYDVNVKVRNRPIVGIDDIRDSKYCDGDDLHLIANTDAEEWDWYGPDGLVVLGTDDLELKGVTMGRLKQGNYKLIGYSSFGCIDSVQQYVHVHRNPIADFDLNMRCKFPIANEELFLNSRATGADSFEYFIDNEFVSNLPRAKYTFTDTGVSSVSMRVYNEIGCMDEIVKDVIVKQPDFIEIPTAFTPNNDLVNSVFEPVFTEAITNYRLRIYNRWGGKVFEGINKGWDGKLLNGKEAMAGAYVVTVDYSSFCSDDESKFTNPPRYKVSENTKVQGVLILIR